MRTKLLLLLSFIAISVGLYGVINPPKSEDLSRIQSVIESKPIFYRAYFANKDITSGQSISNKDYTIRTLSSDEASKLGISSDITLNLPVGSVYRESLKEGAIVMQEDILMPTEPGYIDAIITPNHVPYAVRVNPETIVGGLIDSGSRVDVLAITQPSEGYGNTQISIEPILVGINVLQVKQEAKNVASNKTSQSTDNHLILELTRKQVAQLTVAKKIAQIEVHKSIGNYSLNDLSANAGDVLPNFKAIKEFRANQVTVK